MHSRCRFVAVMLTLSFATLVQGQVNPGTPSFGAYDRHQYDTVNLQNLNVMLSVPVMSKSGAFPFQASLVGGDSYFSYNGTSLQPGIIAQPITPIINGILSPFGYTQVLAGSTSSVPSCPIGDGTGAATKYSKWYLLMTDGTVHSLPATDVAYGGASCSSTLTDQVIDGTGWTVTVVGGTYNAATQAGVTVVSSAGLTIDIATATIQDAQSTPNKIQYNYPFQGEFVDTLGQGSIALVVDANAYGQLSWFDVNGGNPTESQTFTSATLKTSFGCSGKPDYPATAYAGGLTTNIAFPDGTNLALAWEDNQVTTADYTGRLAKITLRAGGTINYNYNPSNVGASSNYNLNCTYLVPNSMTRTTSDGTTTYTWGAVNNGGGNWGNTTVVTDEGGNQTVYTFTGLTSTGNAAAPVTQALTQVQHWQGYCQPGPAGCNGGGDGILLSTDVYCYNAASGQPGNCATAIVSLPVTEVDVYHTISGMSTSSRTQTQYDKYGNVTYSAQYDFGASSPTQYTNIVYGTNTANVGCSALTNATINNRVCTAYTYVNGSLYAGTAFAYNNSTGNLLTTWKLTNGSAWLTNSTQNSYNPNGTPAATYDLANSPTTYGYSSASYVSCGSCTNYPFPTSITKGGLTTSYTWNGTGGVMLTQVGPNGSSQTSTYGYAGCSGGAADPFWRVMSVTDPLGNEVCNSYPSGSAPDTISSGFTFNSGNSVQNTIITTDGYGRTTNVQKQQGPSATGYDTVSTTYSWSSGDRIVLTNVPCTANLNSSCNYTNTIYLDPLGRDVLSGFGVTAGYVQYQYLQNDILSTLAPQPSGENVKQVQKQYDGLGRLTSACKISTTVSGNVPCSQNNGSYNGVLTTKAYTAASGSQTVTSTRGVQQHIKTYDGLGPRHHSHDP